MPGSDPSNLPLRDIHLPDAVLWWPPAPGWWILSFLVLLITLSVFLYIRRRRKHRMSAIYLAKQELNRIENEFKSNQDKSVLVKQISELIRRVSISLFNRNESASLTGNDWLFFLDELNGDESFTKGIGRVLIEAPYQADPDYDEKDLLNLISTWIDLANKNRSKKGDQK
ncbi:MAG: DUF4381 domain-containing protein [Proteobacteria bacterium]|nr:DUF4381 domain-containing protein [Pseudomonadota bacterium]NOG59652.1 DUF4381 domain-containing protein [Pseudomonadota bacterium]